jgi:4-amino-4-deoxy-L-arabinose transferase-like glycosyltransferase
VTQTLHTDLTSENPPKLFSLPRFAWIVLFIGGCLRLLHNAGMMREPLYYFPLGGHIVFLHTAEAILHGNWFPGSRAFTDNSPLYPYLLALQMSLTGIHNYLALRLLNIVFDLGTICLIMSLGKQYYNERSALVAGLLYAVYGPAIYFSAELIYVSPVLFIVTLAVHFLSNRKYIFAGTAFGIAILIMPNLILCVPILLFAPRVLGRKSQGSDRSCLAAGAQLLLPLFLTLFPCTLINYAKSGHLILLTASAGHNFYIGHNPQATAGYYLPDSVGGIAFTNRGSIFDSMKRIAEETEHRSMDDSEISAYYFRKALASMPGHLKQESGLLLRRFQAMLNSYEATTYGSYSFAEELSPWLHFLPAFPFLAALAVLSLRRRPRRNAFPLFVPILASAASILLFFFLSRFRMPMVPVLCVFGGAGLNELLTTVSRRSWKTAAAQTALAAAVLFIGRTRQALPNSANEWNKIGVIYKLQKNYPAAEAAFLKARAQAPDEANAYRNLAALYRQRGEEDKARAMDAQAQQLSESANGREFQNNLSR